MPIQYARMCEMEQSISVDDAMEQMIQYARMCEMELITALYNAPTTLIQYARMCEMEHRSVFCQMNHFGLNTHVCVRWNALKTNITIMLRETFTPKSEVKFCTH